MGTCLHMWALMYSMFVHMCRVYVARSGSDQRILVVLLFRPSPHPFLGSITFSCVVSGDKSQKEEQQRLSPSELLLTARRRLCG